MRSVLSALLSVSLSCAGVFAYAPGTFATDFSEDTLKVNDILLKRAYTDSVKAGDALYLWDNVERARYVDRYQQSAQGEWQFKQRVNLPGQPLVYSSAAEEEIRPQFQLTVVGNKVMSHATYQLNLLDADGNLLPDPLGNNAEYRVLFGYAPNNYYRAQFVDIANNNLLVWDITSKTLSRWRLNTDNKLELLFKNSLNLNGFTTLISNGQHHFLVEAVTNSKARVHRFNLTTLELGNNWDVPVEVMSSLLGVYTSQLAYVDSYLTPSAHIRRIKLGDTAIVETVPGADFAKKLGSDGQQLYYRNQSGQLCRLDLVNGPAPLCQAIPAEITELRSVQRLGQQLLLLGKNAVFLQQANGELQQLQPSATSRSESFRPGIAAVPQGILTINDWQLIDEKQKIVKLTPKQGAAAGCNSPALDYQRLDKVIHHGNTHSVVAFHQDCTAIHQINSSSTSTEVVLNTQSFTHPGMKFLNYNGNESMLIDNQFVLQIKRNGDNSIKPLTADGFKALAAQASATGWYFGRAATTAGRFELHYSAAGQLNQPPAKIAELATPHFAVSDSHLYGLDKNANAEMQITTWVNNNGKFQQQSDVVLPERYQPGTGQFIQLEVRDNVLLLWLDRKATPDHHALLAFDLKNPDQPAFIGAWTNPLDGREDYGQRSTISVDVQGQNILLQPLATAEVLQIGLTPVVDLAPGIIEQFFVLKEDSDESLPLTLKNATGMQLSILTKPAKGNASLSGNQLRYQPEANFNGEDSLVLSLKNASASYEFPIKLHITPVNDKPVLAPIADLTVENGKTISGTAIATDIDSEKLYYRISEASSGTVTIAEDGKFTYLAKEVGIESFVIEVQDNQGAKANVKVTVTVTPAGAVPPVTAPDQGKKSGGSLGFWCLALVLFWRQRLYGKP